MRGSILLGGVLATGCALGVPPPAAPPAPVPSPVAVSAPAPAALATEPLATEPLAAAEVPLEFDQGPRRLTGTLTLPRRAAGARVPAIVIVPGSGALSRDGVMRGQLGLGFGFELPVYQSLAAGLAARGFAVYRYDKRTCGPFNDCAQNRYPTVPYALRATEFSTFAYLEDATAAIGAVTEHPAIDPRRIFVVGHSQGGSLVPALLQVRPAVAAGVMLAPPFHRLDVLLEQQSARVFWAFTLAGRPAEAARDRAVLADAADALRDLSRGTHLGAPILGEPPGVWDSWMQLSILAPRLARETERPLLVLGGGYDYNVEPGEIAAWKALLDQPPAGPHRVRLLPCVTHALNCISEPDPTRIQASDIGHEVAPELVREIATFLGER